MSEGTEFVGARRGVDGSRGGAASSTRSFVGL